MVGISSGIEYTTVGFLSVVSLSWYNVPYPCGRLGLNGVGIYMLTPSLNPWIWTIIVSHSALNSPIIICSDFLPTSFLNATIVSTIPGVFIRGSGEFQITVQSLARSSYTIQFCISVQQPWLRVSSLSVPQVNYKH